MVNRPLITGIVAAAAAGLVAACGSGPGSTAATAGAGNAQAGGMTISTRTLAGVGTVLTDQSGKTLYTPEQEGNGVIKCTAACLGFWFPVTVGSGVAPHASTALTGTLGSVKRSDGSLQLTYNGHPLYTFKLDDAPGQDHGNDFSDQFGGQSFTWHAVTSAAGGATSGQPASTPSANPYPGGNSGY